eukprot:TRINITY_DN29153_c0_g1_i1.p1 TRINITY_DN29153_c0_g1~~TRINITY_DN29153_c0_g1_i1.p1  ORF type:complete len:452 (+),score=58.41 TRINITY_DN29153_c0_g1_i1:98-1453(+)
MGANINCISRVKAPQPEIGDHLSRRDKLLAMHAFEANESGMLHHLFMRSFMELNTDELYYVRAALDSNLIFGLGGEHFDLRRIVYSDLEEEEQILALNKIHSSCVPPAADTYGFVVLSDVDDTLLPGDDMLGISGSDRSWVLNGTLYPGVKTLLHALRGELGAERDYPVLLTARPPSLVCSLTTKLDGFASPSPKSSAFCNCKGRMAILPGADGFAMISNALRILLCSYETLGSMKLSRVIEYAMLFPDFGGRFVFIGDDGQADLSAGVEMLSLPAPAMEGCESAGYAQHIGAMFAFVAIHAVSNVGGNNHVVDAEKRSAKVKEIRRLHPPLASHAGFAVEQGKGERHRFFYFVDYIDLARQLTEAGWLSTSHVEAVQRAFHRDSAPDPLLAAQKRDIDGLRLGIEARKGTFDEMDEHDQDRFRRAETILKDVDESEKTSSETTSNKRTSG